MEPMENIQYPRKRKKSILCRTSGKIGHVNKKRASAHKRQLWSFDGDNKLEVYKCPSCQQWHVGHLLRYK